MKRFEIAALRDALGDGQFGGWHRDPTTRHTMVKAWEHHTGTERVELELGDTEGPQRRVRILMRDTTDEPWAVAFDGQFRSSIMLMLILIAYRMVNREHGCDYQAGWKDGFLAGRVSGIVDVRKAVDRVW